MYFYLERAKSSSHIHILYFINKPIPVSECVNNVAGILVFAVVSLNILQHSYTCSNVASNL